MKTESMVPIEFLALSGSEPMLQVLPWVSFSCPGWLGTRTFLGNEVWLVHDSPRATHCLESLEDGDKSSRFYTLLSRKLWPEVE